MSVARDFLVLMLLVAVSGWAAAGTVQVDCDDDDTDLARILGQFDEVGNVTIEIRGTCEGNFIVRGDDIALRGSPEGATLKGPPGTEEAVLYVVGDRFGIHDMTVRDGAAGVWIDGTGFGLVSRCDLRNNGLGLFFTSVVNAQIRESNVRFNDVGVIGQLFASFSVVESEISDNTVYGLSAAVNSNFGLVRSTVLRNGDAGIAIEMLASVSVFDSEIAGHTFTGLLVRDRSRANLVSTTVDATTPDTVGLSAYVRDNSRIAVNGSVTMIGGIQVTESSFVNVSSAEVRGSIDLFRFSHASLFNSKVTAGVVCKAGDAVCEGPNEAKTVGCASAPEDCGSSARSTDPAPGARRENVEQLSLTFNRELAPDKSASGSELLAYPGVRLPRRP